MSRIRVRATVSPTIVSRPTEEIVRSLRPDVKLPLKVKPDGRIFDGNTRIKVLEERGYRVSDLPRQTLGDEC